MTPANLDAIRAVHARIPPAGNLPGGWMEAYRQDVGALLSEVSRLRALLAATLAAADEARDVIAGYAPGHTVLLDRLDVVLAGRDEAFAALDTRAPAAPGGSGK